LVQTSFNKVVPIATTAADLAYDRLFVIAPETRTLHRLEAILPAVKDLGRRHKGYGVAAEHYAPVGAALLWMLENGLGTGFTPDVKAAWTEAYSALAGVMTAA